MADANPVNVGGTKADPKKKAEKPAQPEIQYFGEGAEEVKFEIDPKATLIRVYSNGLVLVDY